jgi:hypothetical protein
MRNFVWPDFLNLGVAPPAPRGAMGLAPRIKLVPQFTTGDPFPRIPHPTNGLVFGIYALPLTQAIAGIPFESDETNELLPNPYVG